MRIGVVGPISFYPASRIKSIINSSIMCWNKFCTLWELWVKFYWGKNKTAAQETAFQMALRSCSKEVRGGILQQKTGSPNIKRWLLIKENQISQVKEFSSFLCMGWCKSLTEIIPLMYTSAVRDQYPVFSHPECPWDSPNHIARLLWMTVTSFVYW